MFYPASPVRQRAVWGHKDSNVRLQMNCSLSVETRLSGFGGFLDADFNWWLKISSSLS